MHVLRAGAKCCERLQTKIKTPQLFSVQQSTKRSCIFKQACNFHCQFCFKFVWPFSGDQSLKGLNILLDSNKKVQLNTFSKLINQGRFTTCPFKFSISYDLNWLFQKKILVQFYWIFRLSDNIYKYIFKMNKKHRKRIKICFKQIIFFVVVVAGIPLNCFLSSKLGNFLLIHDDSEQVCYTRYQVLFYLWWIRPVPKHCKVSKYYDQDYRWKISFQKALLTIQVIPQQK